MTREFLIQAQMGSLCDAAVAAWMTRKRKQPKATFTWNGQDYAAQRSRYEMAIDTVEGVLMAGRYYD